MKIGLRILLLLFCFATLAIASRAAAGDIKNKDFSDAKWHWTFLGGYSTAHPGFGATDTRVQAIDLIAQYGYYLTPETGKSWYKGRHKILLEVPLSVVYHPESGMITGVNILAAWDFTSLKKIVPYVFAGGGMVYSNLKEAGFGSDYNGNYQGGLGFHYFTKDNLIVEFNYRLHHISNADTADPNTPLNSSKFLIGISFLY